MTPNELNYYRDFEMVVERGRLKNFRHSTCEEPLFSSGESSNYAAAGFAAAAMGMPAGGLISASGAKKTMALLEFELNGKRMKGLFSDLKNSMNLAENDEVDVAFYNQQSMVQTPFAVARPSDRSIVMYPGAGAGDRARIRNAWRLFRLISAGSAIAMFITFTLVFSTVEWLSNFGVISTLIGLVGGIIFMLGLAGVCIYFYLEKKTWITSLILGVLVLAGLLVHLSQLTFANIVGFTFIAAFFLAGAALFTYREVVVKDRISGLLSQDIFKAFKWPDPDNIRLAQKKSRQGINSVDYFEYPESLTKN